MSDVVFDRMLFDHLDKVTDQTNRIAALEEEIARLLLTDAEREALRDGIYLCESAAGLADENANAHAWATVAVTLRGLLERHGGCPEREQPARKGEATPARSGETGDGSPDRE